MILLTHISIALLSIGFTTYLLFAPSRVKFRISYVLVGLTLVSGTYLTVSQSVHLLHACISGLIYVGLVSAVITTARHKFVHAHH